MATISLGGARGGAPGTFIYESAEASRASVASFNTVYMLVEAPQAASVATFPFNSPVFVASLNEYENLIGELPTSGAELDSYYAVKAFFQQCGVGDLRVTRVGIPSNIVGVSFDPSANIDNGVAAPKKISKGDTFFVKLEINGVELGARNSAGAWLGVSVTSPVDYVVGDDSNNLLISTAIRDAVVDAIEANSDISAGAYIRKTAESGDQAAFHITGRVFNSVVEVVNSNSITGAQYILAAAGYGISNIEESEETVYDYVQCVRTAFDGTNLPQGYMIAPPAFRKFGKSDRVNLGQTMEEICSDQNHKWMALVDCGPYFVTDIETYSGYEPHNPSDGFETDGLYLVDNVIYEWTDTSPLNFTQVNYDAESAVDSANSSISDGIRLAMKDDQQVRMNVAATPATDIITLAEEWDVDALPSGTLVSVALFENTPSPTAPLYSDTFTSVTSESLIGSFYVIASDIDNSLTSTQIKLATSKSRASADQPIDITTGGTPQGGGLLVLSYSTPAWEFEVEIKGKTSSLVEANGGTEDVSFNTLHLPGTLQAPTAQHDFKSTVRQLTDPSASIFSGGLLQRYFSAADVDTVADQITIVNHGLTTGDALNYYLLPSDGAASPTGLSTGTTYYVIRIDNNVIQLATSLANATAGTAIVLGTAGTDSTTVLNPDGGAAQSLVTAGRDAIIFSAEHPVLTADKLRFDGDIATATETIFEGTTATSSDVYFAEKIDRNLLRLARSASDLASEAFADFPTAAITTSTPVRFYKKMGVALDGGEFSDAGVLRYIRGRKYELDVTLAVSGVRDEANVAVQTGANDPYGVAYTADISTDLRLSYAEAPQAVPVYEVAAADVTFASDEITITSHGYLTGDQVTVNTATGATLASGLTDGATYFVITVDPNTISFADSAADAVAGTAVTITDAGTDNAGGVEFLVTSASNPFTFQYTEDDIAVPLNPAQDFAGENNFICVPLSTGAQANTSFSEMYLHLVLQTGQQYDTLYDGYVTAELLEPSADVPNNLWNFNAVTAGDLVNEALRGVNNGGVPQVAVIEKGMDSHNRLFEEALSYSTTQGFLAYYAPYVKNDVGIFIQPTSYVAGLAIRRYRDEASGFRLPPAGAKYSLAGARGVEIQISSAQQEVSNPQGLNALRQLPGYSSVDADTGEVFGPVFVWGSRTRVNRGNATQALYSFVNTRVILNVIYGSMLSAFDGQIFNVIDGRAVTFNQIRAIAHNTLYENFYIPGALFGATPAEAFEVVCDERNNPAGALENGFVNVKVFVVPAPTLERIEVDLVRVGIGGIPDALSQQGLN